MSKFLAQVLAVILFVAFAPVASAQNQPAPAPEPVAEGEQEPGKPQEAAPTTEEELEPGHKLRGKVQSIAGDDVFFDVGFRSPALVSLRQACGSGVSGRW